MRKPVWICVLLCMVMIAGLFAVLAGCGSGDGRSSGPTHGIAVFSGGWIGIVDSDAQTVSTPHLLGQIRFDAGTFDAVMTPDGRTGFASSYGDNTVHIFDLADPGTADDIVLGFFAEDMAVTPDGAYLLVTDGGVSPKIAVIDAAGRALVEEFTAPPADDNSVASHQAVAVAADGRTVLTVDYSRGLVNVLTLGSTGNLTYVEPIDISPDNTLHPVNVAISPDGKTAVVAAVAGGIDAAERTANMAFPVLRLAAPGQVAFIGSVAQGADYDAAQSVVFHPNGREAYVYCTRAMPNPAIDNTADPDYPWNEVVVLNVTGPGAVSVSGTSIPVGLRSWSQLFGVDTIAVAPNGRDLYVANMSATGAQSRIQVLDLTSRSVAKTIAFDNVAVPGEDDPVEAIPTGLYFTSSR